MRDTKFIKEIKKENRKFEIARRKSFLRMKFSFGEEKKKRTFSHSIYEYKSIHAQHENALPDSYYFIPTDIVLYDLIRKEDLEKSKKGLFKLFKNCYTHKFLFGSPLDKDIDNLISELDQTLHSGSSWYNIGLFDFAYDTEKDKYINYFEISFHNFSSSYAALEMQVVLADEFKNEISSFIKKQYRKPGRCIHRSWNRNKSVSGAIIGYAVSSGTPSECAKSRLIYEQLEYVKNMFLKEISKYFVLMLYSENRNIYGINIFETNITPNVRLNPAVYSSIGINDLNGFNLSLSERLYVSTETLRTLDNYNSDMLFIYNPELIDGYEMYDSPHNKVLDEFGDYMCELYRVIIIKNLGINYSNLISKYRNKVNYYKANKKSQAKLLKLQYDLSKDFYDFQKIGDELPVQKEIEKVKKILEKNKFSRLSIYHHIHPYHFFTENPKWLWKQIEDNYEEIKKDLTRKIEISSELTSFSREKSNRRLTFYQLILAFVTFVFLLFPDKTKELAKVIKDAWHNIVDLLKLLKNIILDFNFKW